jgi:hypothetical protein
MISKASLAGSLILLAASLGQAVAGPTISDKRYWPNEVGPSAYRQGETAYAQQVPRTRRGSVAQKPASPKSCTYQGGPKSNLWTCR